MLARSLRCLSPATAFRPPLRRLPSLRATPNSSPRFSACWTTLRSIRTSSFSRRGQAGRTADGRPFPNPRRSCTAASGRLTVVECRFPTLSKRLQLRGADLSGREFLGLRRTLALQKADLRNARLRKRRGSRSISTNPIFPCRPGGRPVHWRASASRPPSAMLSCPERCSTWPAPSTHRLFRRQPYQGQDSLRRQFNDGAESFAPVRLHLTGANVEGLTVELVEPEAERPSNRCNIALRLTPMQKAKIQIVNAPVPEITKASGGRCFIATALTVRPAP